MHPLSVLDLPGTLKVANGFYAYSCIVNEQDGMHTYTCYCCTRNARVHVLIVVYWPFVIEFVRTAKMGQLKWTLTICCENILHRQMIHFDCGKVYLQLPSPEIR